MRVYRQSTYQYKNSIKTQLHLNTRMSPSYLNILMSPSYLNTFMSAAPYPKQPYPKAAKFNFKWT